MNKAGIYIHIPFCAQVCNYCDYVTTEFQPEKSTDFVDMLIREIEITAKEFDNNWNFDSVYLGGGSPGQLRAMDIYNILDSLHNTFHIGDLSEITIELNPGEHTLENLKAYREMGINRLSLGFQSLQPNLLALLTRNHNHIDCISLLQNSRNAGFLNINIDMMFNIPGQTVDMWLKNLERLITLDPEHLTFYSLTGEKDTPFYHQLNSGKIHLPSSETYHSMYVRGSELIRDSGYLHYEVSHFSKPGKESRHNMHYWKREPNLALGPSAHGFDGKKRWWNVASLDEYLARLTDNKLPIEDSESISDSTSRNEIIMNGLRTNIGVPLDCLTANGIQQLPIWGKSLTQKNDTIFLEPVFFHLADEIAGELILVK